MTSTPTIAERLRATWPMIKAGPVTTEQRALANEAADAIEELMGALAEAGNWIMKANAPGDDGCDFLNEGGFDELDEIGNVVSAVLAKHRGEG